MAIPLIHNYQIGLKVLTPLHIGSGQVWQSGTDFILDNKANEVCLLDKDRFYLGLDETDRRTYLRLLHGVKLRELENFIQDQNDYSDCIIERLPLGKVELPKEIRAMIRTGGKGREIYIPGSSIKGALASVFFAHLVQTTKERLPDRDPSTALLGGFKDSIMRYIRPYDATIRPEAKGAQQQQQNRTDVQQIDLFNLYRSGSSWISDYKTQGYSLHVEALSVDAVGDFRLGIADGLAAYVAEMERRNNLKLLPKHYKSIVKDGDPWAFMADLVNNYTIAHLKKELVFFEKHPQADDSDLIVECLENVLAKAEATLPGTCVLRMSFGSGFHGITGDWRFADHLYNLDKPDEKNLIYSHTERRKMPARYKSRKVARRYSEVMGFVELSVNHKNT